MKFLFVIILLFSFTYLQAQPYIKGGKTRHRFAQLTLGSDVRFFDASKTQSAFINTIGQIEIKNLNHHFENRLLIGGTHFWGHADFYLAIPLIASSNSNIQSAVETGIKYYPWKIQHQKFRPNIALAMMPISFQQGNGTTLSRFKYPANVGLSNMHRNQLMELTVGVVDNFIPQYYISPSITVPVKTHRNYVGLSYKVMLETTIGAEKSWLNGNTKRVTDTLAKLKKLNGFTLGIGPSAFFFTKSSLHTSAIAPFAAQHKIANVFPEFAIGYYWHKPDLQSNITYRSINSKIKAYSFEQKVQRQSLTLEAYKFLLDYHGFVPFAGMAISKEKLVATETSGQNLETKKISGVKPGLVFGWDIRPNRLQAWYLRTNLRYFPNLSIEMADNKIVTLDGFEFNFIELVVFPKRLLKK